MTRINGFDGLRALAVGLILLFHSGYVHIMGGWVGVDIFFVLSGYLITSLVLPPIEHAKFSYPHFLLRRSVRLMPALMLMIAISYLYFVLSGYSVKSTSLSSLVALTYAMNFFGAAEYSSVYGGLLHTWSLAIEEQFYILWPIGLLYCLSHGGQDLAIKLGLLVIAASVAERYALVVWGGYLSWPFFAFDCRGSQILFGCIVALSTGGSATSTLRVPSITGALSVVALGVFAASADHVDAFVLIFGLPVSGLLSAMLILSLVQHPTSYVASALSLPVLTWFGRISYGVYLWHFPIMIAIRDRGYSDLFVLAGGAVLSVGMATLSFYLVESPCIRWFSKSTRYERSMMLAPAVAAPSA